MNISKIHVDPWEFRSKCPGGIGAVLKQPIQRSSPCCLCCLCCLCLVRRLPWRIVGFDEPYEFDAIWFRERGKGCIRRQGLLVTPLKGSRQMPVSLLYMQDPEEKMQKQLNYIEKAGKSLWVWKSGGAMLRSMTYGFAALLSLSIHRKSCRFVYSIRCIGPNRFESILLSMISLHLIV